MSNHRLLPATLFVLAACIVYAIAVLVFPYHSLNHDEGVYLQQAAMLLNGQLFLYPPVEDAFRPWFFVESGDRLYPKYAPVPAAMFALGKLFGSYRLSLAVIAGVNVVLTYAIVTRLFDFRTGVLAAGGLLTSPLFLVQSAVFLPYAPTTMWNLLFAASYFAADASDSRWWAALAGSAIGIAFFSRPYSAVLFAFPFIVHAAWTLRTRERETIVRQGVTASFGLAGVVVALAYNAIVTGSPWLFPYLAFAPRDGLGFGTHAILSYERTYTPELAFRANTELLSLFFTEWVAAGLLGSLLACVGLFVFFVQTIQARYTARSIHLYRVIVLGVAVSVIVGNAFFWGTLNILGTLGTPNDGLVYYLGPYYHFDLLFPMAAFAAFGTVKTGRSIKRYVRERVSPERTRAVIVGVVLIVGAVYSAALVSTAAPPLQRNLDVTDHYEAAYQPFEERTFDNAVVFLPTPYGNWLNHPFQMLRNDPGFDGPVLYALRENQFAVIDAFPHRTFYRYTYPGEWSPTIGPPVDPRLQRIRTVRGERLILATTLAVPEEAKLISIRFASEKDHAYFVANATSDRLPLRLVVENGTAHIEGPIRSLSDGTVPIDDRDELRLSVFIDYGTGAGITYRVKLPIATDHGTVLSLTPFLKICRLPLRCTGKAAFESNEYEGRFIRAEFLKTEYNETESTRKDMTTTKFRLT